MATIRLLDARLGLNRKCEELFGNAKIAEAIYRFLCDGIEECEDAEPQRKHGEWIDVNFDGTLHECSVCHERSCCNGNFCPDCGADMRGGDA